VNAWESSSDVLKATALPRSWARAGEPSLRYPGESGHVSVDKPEPRTLTEADPFIICRFAGYAAEHVVLKSQLCIEGQDGEVIWKFVRPLFVPSVALNFTDRMERRPVKLMQLRRGTIVRLADALSERRRLTRDEVLNIVGGPNDAHTSKM